MYVHSNKSVVGKARLVGPFLNKEMWVELI